MSSLPQPASSGILIRDGRFLLVRRRNPPAADMYAFPGGRSEPGETPEQTAIREFAEETGLTVYGPTLFATYDLESRDAKGEVTSHFFLSVFLVEADSETPAAPADDAADLGWFTADAVRDLPVPESVRECVEKLAKNGTW